MQVDVYKTDGTPSGEKMELDPAIFGITPSDHAIYMAVRSILTWVNSRYRLNCRMRRRAVRAWENRNVRNLLCYGT